MKNSKILKLLLMLAMLAVVFSCTDDTDTTQGEAQKPVIEFDAEDDVYRIKAGASLWLEPTVTNVENAAFNWIMYGESIGTEMIYLFTETVPGQYYITFEVKTNLHETAKEIRVDVLADIPPVITMAIPDEGFIMLVGTEKTFSPSVLYADQDGFRWSIDGKTVAETPAYSYRPESTGEYKVEFSATNEDGTGKIDFNVSVRNAEDMPLVWEWEKDSFSIMAGRTIVLGPLSVRGGEDAIVTWTLDGTEIQKGRSFFYAFTPAAVGEYSFTVTMENEFASISRDIRVMVFDNEDGFLRPITAASSCEAQKVWEFLPAPGQFVNENYTAENMKEACLYAEGRLKQKAYVSLGGFGGYVIVGFDHSVLNDGGYNIQILGNSFDGSSEPGIVWVMQDENGDGEPNDTWYELKGSEYGKPETLQDYAVTYYRPSGPGMDVAWTDNYGNEGTVDYLANFHKQDSYYPNWVTANSYTLRGTRLKDRTIDQSGNGTYWHHDAFEWGYADNFSPVDRLTDDNNHTANVNANHFKIGNAVDAAGNPVDLKYIDFVKIQTGVNAKAGWLGENSTEVFGVIDYNMIKN